MMTHYLLEMPNPHAVGNVLQYSNDEMEETFTRDQISTLKRGEVIKHCWTFGKIEQVVYIVDMIAVSRAKVISK